MARVLIVSDDPQIVKLIGLNLDKRNYEQVSCDSSLTSIVEQGIPTCDLILLDADLSQERHIATAKLLADISSPRHIPIILISPVKPAKRELAELGIVDQAAKPFAMEELLNKINRVLTGQY